MISAIILAGGKGERLFPLTNTRPKPLCPINGIPPLIRAVKKAEEAGAAEIIVTAFYMHRQIENALIGFPCVKVVREDSPLGTAGAVKNAAPKGDTLLILSGDAVFDFSLEEAALLHEKYKPAVTIVTARVSQPTEYGVVLTNSNKIEEFVEKPSWQRVMSDTVNTGIYFLNTSCLDFIPGDKAFDFAKDLFPALIKAELEIYQWQGNGYWCDIGNPQSFYSCSMTLSKNENAIDPTAVVGGAVNKSVIMENTVIGSGTIIDRSIICENVTIGERCYIPEGCVIGGGTVISDDTVLNKNITVTSNVFIGKGGRIMKNIYFNETKKRLFDQDTGIGGIYGQTFDTADAVYLGQALCQMEKRGQKTKIGVMYSEDLRSRLIADSIGCGIRFGGGEFLSLGSGFSALCGFSIKEYVLDYAVFAAVAMDKTISITVFDKYGINLSREGERRLEAFFYKRSIPDSLPALPRNAEFTDSPRYLYSNMLLSQSDRLDGLELGISSCEEANNIFTEAARRLGVKQFDKKTNSDIFTVSHDGSSISAITSQGKQVSGWHLLCTYYKYTAAESINFTAYLDELSPSAVSEFLTSKGIKTAYYNDTETENRRNASAERCLFDGAVLGLRILNIMNKTRKTLDKLIDELPVFFVKTMEVAFDEEQKAAAARRLSSQCSSRKHGMRFVFDDLGTVTIAPANGAAFRLFAESVSAEIAEDLCGIARKKLFENTNE